MTCKLWVDKGHMACTSWGDEVSASCSEWKDEGQDECSSWADEGSSECSSWADQGSDECSSWADQGSDECSSWADEGSNQCASSYLNKCHWYSPWNCIAGWICQGWYWVANWVCQGWYWVANWVCQGWYWVANWVCQGWYWLANWVCQAWYWVANLVCQAFVIVVQAVCLVLSWIAKWVCAVWDEATCFARGIIFGKKTSKSPVKHVFVLMMENRSFDHMLGLSNITGIDAVTGTVRHAEALDGPSYASDSAMPSGLDSFPPAGNALFKLNEKKDDPGHEFGDTLIQLCGEGATYAGGPYPAFERNLNLFLSTKALVAHNKSVNPIKCYDPPQLPVLNALATEFALCDRWFSSVPGPTWPNRFFLHAASSGGLDGSPSGLTSFGNVAFDGYTFANGSVFDLLDDNCIEWRIFAGDSFPQVLALSGMTIAELQGRIHDFDDFEEAVNDKELSASYIFIEPDYGHILPPTAEDYTCGNSQHPVDDVTRGERLIKKVYETIRNSPHWESSMLLITYDEHGGFFDHVPPPTANSPGDGIADEDNNHNNFSFTQLGLRVPAIVISPLIRKNTLDATLYEHSTLLATLESFFGLKPLTNRDLTASTLDHLFSLPSARTDTPATLPNPAESDFSCDGGPNFVETGEVSTGLQAERDGDGWRDYRGPVDGSQRGFLEIALFKALALARGRDRPQIRKEYLAIQTHGGARRFMRKVAFMAQGTRVPAPGVRGKTKRSTLFGLSPQRTWWADPISHYRQPLDRRTDERPREPVQAQ